MNERRHPKLKLNDEDAVRKLSRGTRRGLLAGGVAAVAGVGFYEWLTNAEDEDGLAWPQRRILQMNEKAARAYLSDRHEMATAKRDQIGGVKTNGDYGLKGKVDRAAWRMNVSNQDGKTRRFSLVDVQAMPRTEMTTRFCCIEGWSGVAHWAGVRFADFTSSFLGTGTKPPPYVSMATADAEYYVGLDRESALHPQTLLAYEQNGKPLEDQRGAPLRLVIPVKYGIKNIKRIGKIQYMNERPGDYWAEEGYDWFAGL